MSQTTHPGIVIGVSRVRRTVVAAVFAALLTAGLIAAGLLTAGHPAATAHPTAMNPMYSVAINTGKAAD